MNIKIIILNCRNSRERRRFILLIAFGNDELQSGYRSYFELLALAIKTEIEPLFKHRGRFEDYYSWQKEFERLGLSRASFENDVMEKLNDYENKVYYK